MTLRILTSLAASNALSSSAQANLLTNGSFETDVTSVPAPGGAG